MTSTEIIDGIQVVHLGDGANTIDASFLDALEAALDQIDADDGLVGLVTIGDGKAYSQGYDLDAFATLGDALPAFIDRSVRLLSRVLVAPVPTVAALNGHTFGYGAMLALAHDLRVQREDRGWFCLPEVDLGLQFHELQLSLIQAKLAPSAVAESILGGRRWDGPAAHAAGIVDATAAEGALLRAAVDLALVRAGKDRRIVTALKRDLYASTVARTPPAP
ncbi:MAG: enoyl-CoA hydratase/isomerase family protein [Acidimicrobiales bacterium]